MREIKFRAWGEASKKMICPDNELTSGEIVDRAVNVMQFTGLKDKNGKEIYEGDIIEVTWTDVMGTSQNKKIRHEVKFCTENKIEVKQINKEVLVGYKLGFQCLNKAFTKTPKSSATSTRILIY